MLVAARYKKIVLSAAVVFTVIFGFFQFAPSSLAAVGIHKQINFQGKLQNTNGTNVTDTNYSVTFTLYDAASAGTNLWDEVQTVATTDGIFRVSLGSVDTTLGDVNFNSDSLYLGVKVGADAEMTPRIRFTAVPYAFNATKVNGLTVTNTSDNPFSSTTVLKIGDGKTVSIANGLTFSGTDSTAFVFPSTGGNVVTEAFTQTLTNKTIGSTGLTFSGATTDITTGTDEDLTLLANGTGVINLNDSIKTNFTGNNAVLFGTVTTGVLASATTSTSGQCLLSGASATFTPAWATCPGGGGATAWDDITVPTDVLSLAMSTHTTTFNWATGTSTNNLFSLTTDASANGTGALLNLQTGASSTVLPLRVRAGAVEGLMVNATGNVGIGTTDPLSLLHLRTSQPSLILSNTVDNQTNSGTLDLLELGQFGTASSFGFRITNDGAANKLLFQSGNQTTVNTRLAILRDSGNVGIGTTDPVSLLDVIQAAAPTTNVARIGNSVGTSTTLVDGLQIDFATAGTTVSADNSGLRVNVTSNNSGATTTLRGIDIADLSSAEANSTETGLRIGTGWDVGVSVESGGITLSGGSFSLTGSARPGRKVTLSPEFEGAVLTGDGSSNTGTMTSDFCENGASTDIPNTNTTVCNTSGDIHNYYSWTTSQASVQDYDIWIRWRVPDNLSAWDSNPVQVYGKRTDATNNAVTVYIYDTAGTLNNAGGTQVAGTAWTQTAIALSGGTWTAGSYVTIRIVLNADTGGDSVQVGEINLNYLSSN